MAGVTRQESKVNPALQKRLSDRWNAQWPDLDVKLVIEGLPGADDAIDRCLTAGYVQLDVPEGMQMLLTKSRKGLLFGKDRKTVLAERQAVLGAHNNMFPGGVESIPLAYGDD